MRREEIPQAVLGPCWVRKAAPTLPWRESESAAHLSSPASCASSWNASKMHIPVECKVRMLLHWAQWLNVIKRLQVIGTGEAGAKLASGAGCVLFQAAIMGQDSSPDSVLDTSRYASDSWTRR